MGNVLAISDAVAGNRGDRDMAYDALNRLTQVTGNNGPSPMFGTASYAYDVADNLVHVQVSGGSQARNQDYVYDAANRLTNVMAGGASVIGLGYDVQGNLVNRNGTLYGFDYGNRLRSGGPETYRYDVQGRRIRSSSSAGLIYSLYSQSGQLLFQRDERAGKRRQYVYLGGSLVAESAVPLAGGAATVTYQHTDALGSPVATTNASKTVLERSEYEPYGYLLNRPMEDGPGYTGHVTDAATGLVYMQQRYYDPLCGCFLSADPVTALGGAFNRYWYANANPFRFTDPDGRDGEPAPGCGRNGWCRRARHEENQRRGNAPYTWGGGSTSGGYTPQTNRPVAPAGSTSYGPLRSGYVYGTSNSVPSSKREPAQPGNGTVQLGLKVEGALGPFSLSVAAGIAGDGRGNLALYSESGTGGGVRGDAHAGVTIHWTNASSVRALEGLSYSGSGGGGLGPYAGGDVSYSPPAGGASAVYGGGFTVGTGAGGGGSVERTTTTIYVIGDEL